MGFNSGFKGLKKAYGYVLTLWAFMAGYKVKCTFTFAFYLSFYMK